MTLKERLQNHVMVTVYYLGCFFVALLILALVMFTALKIEQNSNHLQLQEGYVTEKYVDGEHYWYSSWTFGDISITRRHGGERAYCITVQNGDTIDYWTIYEEQWNKVAIGDFVRR